MKKVISGFVSIVFMMTMIINIIPAEIVLAGSLDSILVLKVDGKEVDINSKVELKEGQTVEFHLDYATKDKKPDDGDKFIFKLPEVFKDIIPSYPEHHFKDMNISESNGSKIVTLICGNQIDTAIRGELGMSATVGSIEKEEEKKISIDIAGDKIDININLVPQDTTGTLINKKITNQPGTKPNYTILSNEEGIVVGEEVEYSVLINEKATSLKDAAFEDAIPTGMTLIEDSVKLEKLSEDGTGKEVKCDPKIKNNILSIDLGDISNTYVITYKTKVEEGRAKYVNSAKITSSNNKDAEDSVTATAEIVDRPGDSNVVKTVNTMDNPYYTPNALTITPDENGSVKGQKYHHTIKINDKEGKYGQYEEKSDVVLKDEIPEGTEIIKDSVKVYKYVKGNKVDVTDEFYSQSKNITSKGNLEIEFKDIAHKYTVEYDIKITEDKEKYENVANLTWDGGKDSDKTTLTPSYAVPGNNDLLKQANGQSDNAVVKPNEVTGEVVGQTVDYSILVNDKLEKKEDAKLTDNIPDGMELDLNSIVIKKETSKYNWVNVDEEFLSKVKASSSKNKLVINFGTIKERYKVEYKTKIVEKKDSYKNTAVLTSEKDKEESSVVVKPGGNPKPIDKPLDKVVLQCGEQQGPIKEYLNNDTIGIGTKVEYRIWVNSRLEDKKNTTLTDTIPEGMMLLEDTVKIYKDLGDDVYKDVTEEFKKVTGDNLLKVTFGTISDRYKVEYTAQIINLKEQYTNDAELKFNSNEVEKDSVTVIPSKNADSEDNPIEKYVLQDGWKEAKEITIKRDNWLINTIGKEIAYKIKLNQKSLYKEDATLTDVIPDGMKLAEGSVKIYKQGKYSTVDVTDKFQVSYENNKLIINFGEISDKYIVEYKTRITDLKGRFENTATFTYKANTKGDSSSAVVTEESDINFDDNISKFIKADDGLLVNNLSLKPNGINEVINKNINYLVMVNNGLNLTGKAVFEDTIPEGMELNKYYIPVTKQLENGQWVGLTEGEDYKITVSEAGNQDKLKIVINDVTNTRYKIEYNTVIKKYIKDGYKNLAAVTTNKEYKSSTKLDIDIANIVGITKELVSISDVKNSPLPIGTLANYKVTLNPEENELSNVIFKDAVPEGMEIVPSSIKIKNLTKNIDVTNDLKGNIVASGRNFSINIAKVASKYEITYSCKIVEQLDSYTNSATMDAEEYSREASHTLDQYVDSFGLNAIKEADKSIVTNDSDDQNVTYTIKTWANGAIKKGTLNIKDKLDPRLEYLGFEDEAGLFDVNYDKNTNTISVVNKQDIHGFTTEEEGRMVYSRIKIKVSFKNVKGGETISNIAVVNDRTTNEVEVEKEKEKIEYGFTAEKVDSVDNTKKLAGAEFKLYKVNNGKTEFIKDLISGNDGVVSSKLDSAGTYILEEVKAPTGYVTPQYKEQFVVSDSNNQVNLGKILNKKKEYSFTATKIDGETNKPLAGAEFKLYKVTDNNSELIKTITSSDTGVITSKVDGVGTYLLEEVKAPTGYVTPTYKEKFEITEDNNIVDLGNIENIKEVVVKKEYSFTATKVDSNDKTKVLPGAEFKLYKVVDKKEVFVKDLISGNDGTISSTLDEAGTYVLEEVKAPEGYEEPNFKKTFEVTDNKNVVNLGKIENKEKEEEKIEYSFTATKVDSIDKNTVLAGAEFKLYKVTDGKAKLIDTITSDKKGVVSSKLSEAGTYILEETKAPSGYLTPEYKEKFEVTDEVNKVDLGTILNEKEKIVIEEEDKLPEEEIEEGTKAEQDFVEEEEAADSEEAEEEEADEIQNGISTGDVGIGAAVIAAIGAGAGLFINNRRKKK